MKKMPLKALAIFLLVMLLASGNGMTVLAQGVAEELQKSEDVQENIEEDIPVSDDEEKEEQEESLEDVKEDEELKGDLEEEMEEIEEASSKEPPLEDIPLLDDEFVIEKEEDLFLATEKASGDWGTSVRWTLDEEGVLTITQDESVPYEYFEDDVPWSKYAGDITKIVWGANCLKDLGDGKVKSAIDFGERTSDFAFNYVNAYSKLEVIEFTEHVSMEYITDMSEMFCGCEQLVSLDVSGFNTANVTDMSGMFSDCSSLSDLDVSGFDTSNVTNMSYMFMRCSNLRDLDVSGLDTENVTDMSYMFATCGRLASLDVSVLDTSNVTDMSYMFRHCVDLLDLDISGLNTENVTDMSFMFSECMVLPELDVSGFDTSNVTDMKYMFHNCNNLLKLDVSSFNTAKVTTMNSMFYNCISLTELNVTGLNTENVTDMSNMFVSCGSLTELDVSSFNTGKVTRMHWMFDACTYLTELDVSGFNTENVNFMQHMFSGCISLCKLDVSSWNTEKVTNMSAMFEDCDELTELNVSSWNTGKVTNMSEMFCCCNKLESLDVSGFNTANVTDMSAMFSGCSSLVDLDVSGFDTAKVTTMASAFSGCNRLAELDVSGFDTTKVTIMASMFSGCNRLAELDVSNWNTENVTDMENMFSECNGLAELDVSNWNTGNVKRMESMFSECNRLTELDVSNWNTENLIYMTGMFANCNSLAELDVSDFKTKNVRIMSRTFFGCNRLAELDVSNWNTENLVSMYGMFANCYNLKTLQLGAFDCGKVSSGKGNAFLEGCNNLEQIETPKNIQASVSLPSGEGWTEWHLKDSEETFTYLPIGETESFTLVREYKPEETVISLTGLAFNQEQIEVYKGEEIELSVAMEPQNANDLRLLWKSSNPSIAFVNTQNGMVFAGNKAGEAIITVSAISSPEVSASCKIIVNNLASGVKLSLDCAKDGEEYVLFKNDILEPKLTWENGTMWEEVSYEVTGDAAEFVDGKLIAKECGIGTLTVTARNGDKYVMSDSLTYHVYEEPGAIVLNNENFAFDLKKGAPKQIELEAKVMNRDSIKRRVDFSISGSNNLQLIDHKNNKATIKHLNDQPGSAVITATAVDGNQKSMTFNVIAGNMVEAISINSSLPLYDPASRLILKGKTENLKAEVLPSHATIKEIRWESSNPEIASIDSKGKITAHKLGYTTVYACATDGSGVSQAFPLYVLNATAQVKLNVKDNNGGEYENNAISLYEPVTSALFCVENICYDKEGNSDYKNVSQEIEWQLSGNSAKIATIKNGEVFVKKAGTITITGIALDGSKKKSSVKVKVEQHVYQLDAKAPKNVMETMSGSETYWQVFTSNKKTTITPTIQYNGGASIPDKKWKKYEIILSEEAKEVMQTNKNKTAIVINANAAPGEYPVTFYTTDGVRTVSDSVVIRISDTVYDADVVWPSNVIPTGDIQMLAEGIKLNLSTKVNGVVKNSAYQYQWKLDGRAENQGTATISAKGDLDLKKAIAGDVYTLTLDVCKNNECVKEVSYSLAIKKQIDKETIKLLLSETEEEFPAKLETAYAIGGKAVSIFMSSDTAELYQFSGGKKGVLRLEKSASGYVFYSEGVGTAKVTLKAMDGSNIKKDFTLKVEKASNPVAQFIAPKGSISMSRDSFVDIDYKLLTKDATAPTDCRIKWEISNLNKVYFPEEGYGSKITMTDAASGSIRVAGSVATLFDATLTGTTMDGSNKKVKIKIKVQNRTLNWDDNQVLLIAPLTNTAYVGGNPVLVHGKSMKLSAESNYVGYDKKRITYEISGKTETGEVILQEELKQLGITMQKGMLKVASKSTFSGIVTVKAAYTEPTRIEPSKWEEYDVRILQPVKKIDIQNVSGETITKADVEAGKSITLSAILSDKNAASNTVCQVVSWSVNDKKSATVTADGVVSISPNAKKNKKIKVTATAQDGSGKKATVTITVK